MSIYPSAIFHLTSAVAPGKGLLFEALIDLSVDFGLGCPDSFSSACFTHCMSRSNKFLVTWWSVSGASALNTVQPGWG